MKAADIQAIRRRALRHLIDTHFRSANAFATALKRSQPMIHALLSGKSGKDKKSFGEKVARDIEDEVRALGYDIPRHYLDTDPDSANRVAEPVSFYRQILPEERQLLDRFSALPRALRESISDVIDAAWDLAQKPTRAVQGKRKRGAVATT